MSKDIVAPRIITEIIECSALRLDPEKQEMIVHCQQRIPNTEIIVPCEIRFNAASLSYLAGGITELVKSGSIGLYEATTAQSH